MKTFKLIDSWLQMAAVAVAFALTASMVIPVYRAYLMTCSVQLFSMVIHEATGTFTSRGTARRRYHNIAYVVVTGLVIALWFPPFVPVFFPLVFVVPFMAAYYAWLCYRETYFYMKRPLSILK